jgi:hypothetical protein
VTRPARSLSDAPPGVSQQPPQRERELSFPVAFLAVVGVSALVIIMCVLGITMSGLFHFGGSTAEPATLATSGPVDLAVRAPSTTFVDGQWMVGGDIQPGTYSTTVPNGSPGCTWERNASADGTAASVLESGNGKEGEPVVVSIKDTDRVFQTKGCGTWQRVSD